MIDITFDVYSDKSKRVVSLDRGVSLFSSVRAPRDFKCSHANFLAFLIKNYTLMKKKLFIFQFLIFVFLSIGKKPNLT